MFRYWHWRDGQLFAVRKHAKCLVIGNIQSLTGLEERLVMQ